ncbi:hypothetical protein ES703_49289 [subsurface metagenome]
MTYNEANHPKDGSVSADEFNAWKHNFRTRIDRPVRYYGVGEYGNKTMRPHYHAILFGVDAVEAEHYLKKTWKLGFIYASEGNAERFAYTAQYCAKKMTTEGHRDLGNLRPEFARMSLKPGIGADMTQHLVDYYYTKGGSAYLAEHGDIAHSFRHDGKIWPFDRYMMNRIRTALNVPHDARGRYEALNFKSEIGPSLEFETDQEVTQSRRFEYDDDLRKSRILNDKLFQRRHSHGTL